MAEHGEGAGIVRLAGAEAIARMLQAHGSGPIFVPGGLSGGPAADPLERAIVALHLAYAPIVDARAAAFAAYAYAEASGRVGLLAVAPGTDLTELPGGLLGAREAGSPLIALLPEPSALEIGVLAGVCKEIIRIEPARAIPGLMRRAFIAATTGRPGPIALVVPAGVRGESAEYREDDLVEHGRFESASALRARPDLDALHDAAERLAAAERPLLVAGPDVHVSRAAKALQEFAETLRLPVAHSAGGIGAVAGGSPLSVGLLAPGTAAAAALAEADLVLAVGGALDEIAGDAPDLVAFAAPLVELEARAEAIGRARPVTVPLWGDPRAAIEALGTVIGLADRPVPEARIAWAEDLAARRAAERAATVLPADGTPTLARLVATLSDYMPADGLLVVDPGAEARAVHLGFDVKRCGRGLIAARLPGADGSAFAAAIGAALAAPGRTVVALANERGAVRALGALESARRLGLPVKFIVADTGAARAAAQPAESAPPADLAQTRFADMATGLGCLGRRAATSAELASALEDVLSYRDGPALLDVVLAAE